MTDPSTRPPTSADGAVETARRFRPRALRVRVVVVVTIAAMTPALFAWVLRESNIVVVTLAALPIALLAGAWLAWRVIRPLAELRRQALAKAPAASAEPIDLSREDEIGDVSEAFNVLLASLDERRRSTEAFVADVAHEVKNPVATIRACADALEQGADPERIARVVRLLRGSSERLDHVVTSVLELARIEARSGADVEAVDVERITRGIADVRADAGANDPRAVDVTRSGSAVVRGDARLIEHALRNLIDNAVAFAGKDGRCSVSIDGGADEEVVVTIRDTGPGVSAERASKIFQRFFTTRAEAGGTGLGLAFVRAIAEAHGGTIEVIPGDHGVFVFTLPRVPPRRPAVHT